MSPDPNLPDGQMCQLVVTATDHEPFRRIAPHLGVVSKGLGGWTHVAEGEQGAPDRLWLLFNHVQQGRGRAADPPRALLPFPIAGEAHAHERGHLGLRELRPLPHFARRYGSMDDGAPFALDMGERLREGLDQISAERTHFVSFQAAFSAAFLLVEEFVGLTGEGRGLGYRLHPTLYTPMG